jgi:DNA-binding response OmpR family regulator
MAWNLFGSKSLSEFDSSLSREQLIQASRIVVIDDEDPLLIRELRDAGFSVDHDEDGNDAKKLEAQIYDLAIVDFYGVGTRYGNRQGLDLLKHIKRVSPRTRLIAYTSRSLKPEEAEFFRLSHVVLPKDKGLAESLVIVEEELRKSFSKAHLFEALLAKLSVDNTNEQEKLRKALLDALTKRDSGLFKKVIVKLLGAAAEKSGEIIVSKLFHGATVASV